MKKLSKILIITVLSVFLVAGSAMAVPSNLKDITGITGTDVYTDTGAESAYLVHTGNADTDATAFLFLEVAAWAATNTFGIYDFTNTGGTITVGNMLEVFDGATSPLFSTTLLWDFSAGTVTNTGTGASAIIDDTFGFYLGTAAGTWSGKSYPAATWHSHTALNVDGGDHVMFFDTSDNTIGDLLGSDIVIAFEDLNMAIGSDYDFTDMVVGVSDVKPIPEPATMLLLGSGLIGIARFGRKKLFRKG